MKKLGCAVAILGLLAVGGGLVLVVGVVRSALEANRVATVPLAIGQKTTTDVIRVSTEKSCQVCVHLELETKSVEETEEFDEEVFKARYHFPVSYRVLGADGEAVFSEEDKAAWKGDRTVTTTYEEVGEAGGELSVEHSYGKFDVPPPGEIKVEIEVHPDNVHGAVAERAEMRVYDNVTRHGESVALMIALFVAGGLLATIGLGLFVFGLVSGSAREAPGAPARPGP
jgi:hypothetical protein